MARPSSYKPEYCETARTFLAQGYSIAALAGEIGVCRDTVIEWCKQFPEFSDAVKDGRAGSAKWWESHLMRILQGDKGNVTAAIFGLKNRAHQDWSDRTVQQHEGSMQIIIAKELDGV